MLKIVAALAVAGALAGGASTAATAQTVVVRPSRPVILPSPRPPLRPPYHRWRHHHWRHHRVCGWHHHHRHCWWRRW
ncbi:MAG: hypothetical protein ACR2FH_10190 [Caulobacteraceae bacterium]